MPQRFLHDAVTLRHFAALRELDILRDRRAHVDPPRWVEEVQEEVVRAEVGGQTSCRDILDCTWLGHPQTPSEADLAQILRLRTRLGGDHPQHLGEASSIYWADQMGAVFVTDDNEAYRFASRRLGGEHRVQDTVAVLAEAVASGEITSGRAADFCERLRSLRPEPRHLRSVHADPLPASAFE